MNVMAVHYWEWAMCTLPSLMALSCHLTPRRQSDVVKLRHATDLTRPNNRWQVPTPGAQIASEMGRVRLWADGLRGSRRR